MVTITVNGNEVIVSGRTFPHREEIKSKLGGKWRPSDKVWVVTNTPENLSILKKLKVSRKCGWCGEVGHFKPNCSKHREHLIKVEYQKAEMARSEPLPYRYNRFKDNDNCKCGIVDREINYLGITVRVPEVCWMCQNYCCAQAVPCPVQPKYMFGRDGNYRCDRCGTATYQERKTMEFMNDTSGT
jgi:hypothetical protein